MTQILFISRCPPWPIYLGDRLILYHLGRELALRNHHLDLLAFADRAEDWGEQHHYDMDFSDVKLFREPRRSQASYLRRAVFPGTRWPKRAENSWSPEMWGAIQKQLAENQYDVVHLFGGIQVYEYLHALGDIPTIITPYESYSLYLRRMVEASGGMTNRMQMRLARQFEHFMFSPYRRTVVVSERDRDELLGINPALKIDVIPNGVDTYRFRPRPTRRIPALLFVGNYEYAPNVDAALHLARDIFPKVQSRIPEAHLWLVGNAPPSELRVLANDAIRVTGRVPDVRPYLARAGAFVSPLRLGAGIKNKVLEAMAMGCPVVATPLSLDGIGVTPGEEVLVGEGAVMVEAIVQALMNDTLGDKLSANGRKLIESRYSWNHVAEQYLALYDDVTA